MINDPLLHTAHQERTKRDLTMNTDTPTTKKSKTKRRPPARSAKILTVGLSTTAMLGMTTGYALADLAQKKDLPATNNAPTNPAIANGSDTPTPGVVIPNNAVTQSAPTPVPTPQVGVPPQAAQLQTPVAPQQEVVIEIPTPQTSGATPGSGNSSWNNQKSSGSN